MEQLVEALLKADNIALVVLTIGNIAQWLDGRETRKLYREDRASDAKITAAWAEKVGDGLRSMERAVIVLTERIKGSP